MPQAWLARVFLQYQRGNEVTGGILKPDAGYEKGFLGPSVEAFSFLVCKKGRSCFLISNWRAMFCGVAIFLFKVSVYELLQSRAERVARGWRMRGSTKN
jgi:hypothetical protein